FGEKYGDEVRVVMMGSRASGRPFSTELCGGTHVRRTGDIGLFKIVSESAVGAGIRRIEAVTGGAALEYVAREEASLRELAQMLRAGPDELPRRVASLLEDRRKLERELAEARRALATGGGNGSGDAFREIAGVRYSPKLLDGVPARDLKSLADDLKKRLGSGVVALVSTADGKASLVVGVTDDLKERISAIDLVRAGSAAVGGKGGGGRPDMAQAGGPDAAHAQAALDAIEQAIAAA
ncbi:MAG: DHHA1 domain-containing protein, partial [Rhodospirillales bacterium]